MHGSGWVRPLPGCLHPLAAVVRLLTAADDETRQQVALRMEHPCGSNVFVLEPSEAMQIGMSLLRAGRQALIETPSGLVVAGG